MRPRSCRRPCVSHAYARCEAVSAMAICEILKSACVFENLLFARQEYWKTAAVTPRAKVSEIDRLQMLTIKRMRLTESVASNPGSETFHPETTALSSR